MDSDLRCGKVRLLLKLVGSAHAYLGLAEFIAVVTSPIGERNRQLALNHPDMAEFKRIGAVATLSMIVTSGVAVPAAGSSISADELNAAANDMNAVAEHMLEIAFADQHDLVAYLNNAGVPFAAGRSACGMRGTSQACNHTSFAANLSCDVFWRCLNLAKADRRTPSRRWRISSTPAAIGRA
ncbi:hypothetical protein NKG99_31395 [Mesorhizobium sp. M1409]|uniref:hypothetical protein n=1 Tax=unclassified Mesorhizobium TaxID=325217 RepID=UPI0033367B3F